jgi:superfamily II DNA or RNA helicase/diadenosine tetraphosphate (Ap4A) HIT family hydrolase/HKD family nuclease
VDTSPFLDVPSSDWLAGNRSAFAIADGYPVAAGHSLVVPRRLVTSWWELAEGERSDVWALVDDVRTILDARHAPDAYNVGFNAGTAAGQTVEHFHLHVIPRYEGDVVDPRGGIRWVIPERANYLVERSGLSAQVRLIDGADERSLKLELLRCLINDAFDRIDLLVSFILPSGLELVERHLRDAIGRGAYVRVLTTDYLAVTDPDALDRLLDLGHVPGGSGAAGRIEVRAFQDPITSFHPKAYIFRSSTGTDGRAFVGSSNLSRSGIDGGIEWSLETGEVAVLVSSFDELWRDARSSIVDEAWLADYRQRYIRRPSPIGVPAAEQAPVAAAEVAAGPASEPPTPRPIQSEALQALEATRAAGHRAGLVVMATGLGKTWLAAFDSRRPDFPRVLFVAHREEILTQARDVFRAVRPGARLGFFTSEEKTTDADVVFATVQTIHRHLSSIPASAFEYLVVDEFHHAAAATYRLVVDHFEPRFLLGLTATPERLDGADLLALCGDNLVYRCDLIEGIERSELAPFRYWGVADTVDFEPIPWRNGRFDPATLEAAVATQERADAAQREWLAHGGDRTLAFCSSIRHAEYMARHFCTLDVAAVAVHSESETGLRRRAIDQLEQARINVVFTVDLFNEGVDIPEIDTVLMLRPTESPVVFLQQLGRGLRKAADKDHLDVIDFVGNHRAFLSPLRTLLSLRLGRAPTQREIAAALRTSDLGLPEGCSVEYSLEAVQLLEAMVRQRPSGATDVLRDLCVQLADETGLRPSALQVALAGGSVRATRRRDSTWFGFVDELGLLTDEEQRVVAAAGAFLAEVQTTPMTRSFKMVLLRAMLHDGRLRTGMSLDDLAARSLQLIQADPRLVADVNAGEFPSLMVVESARWRRYWDRNPVAAWSGGKWFDVHDERIEPRFTIPAGLEDAFDAMVAELVEWRLHEYLTRGADDEAGDSAVLRLSHASGRPMIFLDRQRYPWLPEGDASFLADGEPYVGRFVKVALNVATGSGEGNALPVLLRRWFGPAAGHPGSSHRVMLRRGETDLVMEPLEVGRVDTATGVLPHFPTYAVACGAFNEPVPADAAPHQLSLPGVADLGPDDFLVTVRGDSMSGPPTLLRHGDLVRMRWTRRRTPEALLGRPVLVELADVASRSAALKVLDRDGGGFVLRSTEAGVDDVRGSGQMTVVGELVEKVDPLVWNPLGRWVGQDFRRDGVPALFGLDYNPGNWQSGHVSLAEDTVLFVTLRKEAGREGDDYVDAFEDAETFHWTSQRSTSPEGKKGREILGSVDAGRRLHLFVRRRRQDVAFTCCGLVVARRNEGSRPMVVWFRLLTPLGQHLQLRFLGD